MTSPDYAAAYLLCNYIDRDLFRQHSAEILRKVLRPFAQDTHLPLGGDMAVPAGDTADNLPDRASADKQRRVLQDTRTEELSELLRRHLEPGHIRMAAALYPAFRSGNSSPQLLPYAETTAEPTDFRHSLSAPHREDSFFLVLPLYNFLCR